MRRRLPGPCGSVWRHRCGRCQPLLAEDYQVPIRRSGRPDSIRSGMPGQGQMAIAKISLSSEDHDSSLKNAVPPTWAFRRSFQRLSVSRSSATSASPTRGSTKARSEVGIPNAERLFALRERLFGESERPGEAWECLRGGRERLPELPEHPGAGTEFLITRKDRPDSPLECPGGGRECLLI